MQSLYPVPSDADISDHLQSTLPTCVDPDHIDHGDVIALARGMLMGREQKAVHAHLAKCRYCRTVFLEYQDLVAEEPQNSVRRWRRLGAALGATLGLSLALFFMVPGKPPRQMDLTRISGAMAVQMGGSSEAVHPEAPLNFAPHSQINMLLKPTSEDEQAAAPSLQVFVGPDRDHLQPKPARIELSGRPNYPVLKVSAEGQKWFQEAGSNYLVLRMAHPDELSQAETASYDELCGSRAVHCLEKEVRYQAP